MGIQTLILQLDYALVDTFSTAIPKIFTRILPLKINSNNSKKSTIPNDEDWCLYHWF